MKQVLQRLDEAVNRLVAAEIADSWKGGGHPEDIPDIEAELTCARALYQLSLKQVQDALSRKGVPE